jgi:hypothetical protein
LKDVASSFSKLTFLLRAFSGKRLFSTMKYY